MTTALTLHSPVHELLDTHHATWKRVGDGMIALHFGKPDAEQQAAKALGLCDLSALTKLGLKGRGAADVLRSAGITPPPNRYDTASLQDGGLIIRTDTNEFLLEEGVTGSTVAKLLRELRQSPKADPLLVERTDAAFVLTGSRANEVLRQTCGMNFSDTTAAPLNRLVMSRIAAVSCAILPTLDGPTPRFRLWLDPSFAISLWESLEEIVHDLGGHVVGAAATATNISSAK